MTVHCGYLFLLFLALWAELTAGRALSKDIMSTDPEMRSIIEDLKDALLNYTSIMMETSFLKNVPVLPCTETDAHLEQSSTLVLRLSQYQVCAEQLRSFCPDVTVLREVVMLNQDLLQHLKGSHQDCTGCPSSTFSSHPLDLDSASESIRCIHCWNKQVAALYSQSLTSADSR